MKSIYAKLFLISFIVCLCGVPSNGIDFLSVLGIGRKHKAPQANEDDQIQPVSDEKAQQYLQQFGYVPPANVISGHALAADLSDVKNVFKSAIRKFQEFAGLSPTGELDIRTKKKMAEPRCGVYDVQAITARGHDAAFKWPKERLTYSIMSYSPDLPHDAISAAIQKAFGLWSAVTPLSFTQVSPGDSSADIKVKFASNEHGDPWPFDGRGGVLAHATMPTSGMLHFDEDENWVYMDADKIASYRYTDLLPVAIHEIGHTLGLSHSRSEDSIMAPFYQETVDDNGKYVMPTLRPTDVKAIQEIYGPRRTSSGGGGGRSRGGLFGFGGGGGDDLGGSDFGGASAAGGRGSSGRGGGGPSSGWGDDDGGARPATTTERPHSGGFFGSLWSKWVTGGSSARGRSRSGGDDDDSARGSSSSSSSGSGSRSGQGGSGRGASSSSSSGFGDDGSTSFGAGGFEGDCPRTIDAFTPGVGGVGYMFQGSKVYEVRGHSVLKTHSLRLLFPAGPIYVEAALVNERQQTVALFQSYSVYVYEFNSAARKFALNSGYPKRISRFNPVGAMLWVDGHQFLFSASGEFAVYDDYWNEVTSVNRLSDYFPGFPTAVKGGFAERGTVAMLFTTSRVYRYDATRKTTVGDSQSIAAYLGC